MEEGLINGSSPALVFFGLEPSGSKRDADISQIAMSSGSIKFNGHINPRKRKNVASQIHNLKNDPDGELYYVVNKKRKEVTPLPRDVVMKEVLNYLKKLKRPCILIAHNRTFDYLRLLSAIKDEGLENEFAVVINGFTDISEMFKNKCLERTSKGAFKLETLASELPLSSESVHDAMVRVNSLEIIAFKYFTEKQFVENCMTLDYIRKLAYNKSELTPEKPFISDVMANRLASLGISYNMFNSAYRRGGDAEAIIALLEQRADGKPQAIETKKIENKILDHLKEANPSIQGRVDLSSDITDVRDIIIMMLYDIIIIMNTMP